MHSSHKKRAVGAYGRYFFYGNGTGVGGCVGRPGTTADLHGRLTAAALWCQAESHSLAVAVSCPSSTVMEGWFRADDHLNGWIDVVQ